MVKCWGGGELGKSERPHNPGIAGATRISLGSGHACALLAGGGVKCWGDNTYGQLGDGWAYHGDLGPDLFHDSSPAAVRVQGIYDATAISASEVHTCALLSNGMVACWGSGPIRRAGFEAGSNAASPVWVGGINGATGIASGDDGNCALLAGGRVECWANEYRNLGNSSREYRSLPAAVGGLESATAVAMGARHSCALLSSRTVKCWGANDAGQLGDGSADRGHKAQQGGDFRTTAVEVKGLGARARSEASTKNGAKR
jgi:alpha-tubulin suppressor-like RCC1 family protein